MKGSLYRFYADGGTLLYVGQSRNPFKRMDGHFKDKDMTDVRYIEIEWFQDRKGAVEAESHAINRENPLWNKAGVDAGRTCRVTWPDEALQHVRLLWLSPSDDAHVAKRASNIIGCALTVEMLTEVLGHRRR
jgi:hypothetical protein